jgi:hypothetical protein
MRRILGSLAVLFLGAVMTAYGYTQASTCCSGHCGCGDNATCMQSGHCDGACKGKNCCGKVCAKDCCQGKEAGKACGSMCAQMHSGKDCGDMCGKMTH